MRESVVELVNERHLSRFGPLLCLDDKRSQVS